MIYACEASDCRGADTHALQAATTDYASQAHRLPPLHNDKGYTAMRGCVTAEGDGHRHTLRVRTEDTDRSQTVNTVNGMAETPTGGGARGDLSCTGAFSVSRVSVSNAPPAGHLLHDASGRGTPNMVDWALVERVGVDGWEILPIATYSVSTHGARSRTVSYAPSPRPQRATTSDGDGTTALTPEYPLIKGHMCPFPNTWPDPPSLKAPGTTPCVGCA
jgi:hypothetical protein